MVAFSLVPGDGGRSLLHIERTGILKLERTLAMVSSIALGLTLCGCNQPAPATHQQPPTKDNRELDTMPMQTPSPSNEGNWQATKAILGGAPFPDSVTEGITLSIIGTEYSVLVGGSPDKGTCELDTSSSPLRMAIRGTEGPNTGKTFLAICDFPNSEEMRVCYDMKGVSYPGEFTSTAENGYFLVNYRRKN